MIVPSALVPPRPGPTLIDAFLDELPDSGLVVRRFHYLGKGREQVVEVTLRADAMAALLRAMRQEPGIQIAVGSDYAASSSLRESAEPCPGHESGTAVDAFLLMPSERRAMFTAGFEATVGLPDEHLVLR